MAMKCPRCGNNSHTKASRYVADGLKEQYYQCQNIECSATFLTREEFCYFVSEPSDKKLTEEQKKIAWDKAAPNKRMRGKKKVCS